MPLYLDVQPGESVRIGESTIAVEQKSGKRTRLRIDSPDRVEHVKADAKPAMTQPDIPPQPPRPAPAAAGARPRLTMPSMPLPA